MKSLRSKLIVIVVLIVFVSFLTVLVSNLQLMKQDKQEEVLLANRQVSELVSRFVLSQVSEYRREIQGVFGAWSQNADFQTSADFLADYLWIEFIDWNGETAFEWSDKKALYDANLPVSRLLGKINRNSLYSEVKQVLSRRQEWLMLNSTVDPFIPTFLLAIPVSKKGDEDARFVALAEIRAESLLNQIHSRKGQKLVLLDSHDNILLSTEEGWDPSKIVFKDDRVLSKLNEIKIGEEFLDTIDDVKGGSKLTFMRRFQEGHGLSLLLQEPAENLLKSQRKIQVQSALVGLIVLIIVINLIILMAHRMTSPLKTLIQLMKKAGEGEFHGRIKVKSNDEIGQLTKVFNKMLIDLTEREEEVSRAKQKLIQSEKMSAFGQMSAGIAHEVKNPLAGILGYAQMAKKKLDDRPELKNYMEIIEKETTRCKEIVENLMKFARQEKANLQRIDINKTVKDSVRLVEHQITVSGIKLNQMYALDGQPIMIDGNPNQIQQVMLNLMLNAQHAMDGKGSLTVSTHYDERNSRVMILVSDTGMGIPPDVLNRIFEPFFTTKGVGKGTGLGLSVSLGIIKDHKGKVEVDSTEGKGTTFTISLPVPAANKVEDTAPEANVSENAKVVEEQSKAAPASTDQTKKVSSS